MGKCPGSKPPWPWCPFCYEGIRHRTYHKGHFHYRTPSGRPRRFSLPLPTKTAPAGTNGSSSSVVLVAGPLDGLSEVWAFLTATAYPDGTKRLTGRLSFSCEKGVLSVSLTDQETSQYVIRSGRSLSDILLALEAGLASGDLDWAPSRWSGKGRR